MCLTAYVGSLLFGAPALQIGKLMKAGQADEAKEKKVEVESINKVAGSAEEDLNKVRRLMRMHHIPRQCCCC